MNHGYPRVGQEPDDSILADYLNQQYLVVTVDFAGVTNAVSPAFDFDLLALQRAIYGYHTTSLLVDTPLKPEDDYCWFLPAGCRLVRNLNYFDLARHGSFGTKEKVLEIWNTTIHKKFGVPRLTDPEAMRNRDRTPLDYKLYMDIIYPSQPNRKLPLFIYQATQSNRTRCSRSETVTGAHIFGFEMRGYVMAIVDHCWNPLSRHGSYGFLKGQFSLDNWNGLKANTSAVRFLRAHADVYGIDPNFVGAMGYSKGSYSVTRLSDPNHETQDEYATFSGFPAGSPEPQPWRGYSSRITAGYQAVGGGTDKPEYVTSNQVPTVTACGRFDKFNKWPGFPSLVEVYESRNVNHLAIWMHELEHEPPHGFDPWLGRDRYALFVNFFDQYLKPREKSSPQVLYTFPVHDRTNVTTKGYSQALPDHSLLPTNALQHVAFKEPITVHFAPRMDVRSVVQGGVRLVRKSDGVEVAGNWSAKRGNTVFMFIPSGKLDPQTAYQLTFTTGVKNEAGNALADKKIIEFRTGSSDSAGQ